MLSYERSRVVRAAQLILDQGGWCVYEVCLDVPHQRWEARALIFDLFADAVADAIEEEIAAEPEYDARLTGCDRRTLAPAPEMEAHLCYVASEVTTTASAPTRARSPRTPTGDGAEVLVRDAMNPIVVTLGPDHTLREAAKRMTARGVGAAVVIDPVLPGPRIITEREILRCNGLGQSVDSEPVHAHLEPERAHAHADWPLEHAATAMGRGGLRHVVVLDGADIVGILSMRDIVRCWTLDVAR